MGFKLLGQPMVEEHAENIIHLFVRDMNGAPMSSARIKIWAGPAPTGLPAYWTDDSSFRNPGA
ncbi:MAG: hypothetical protein HY257_10430, partial [Chloroflexi bacterium]|nr:hypothetical protein [Chloroflexota bacterium]